MRISILTVFFLVLLALSSCSMSQNNNRASESGGVAESVEPIDRDFFAPGVQCSRLWSEIYQEWKANGGGIKKSLVSTRQQIKNDAHSRFASLARDVWASQEKYRLKSEIGHWPVSESQRLDVFRNYEYASVIDSDLEECGAFVYVEPLLWKDIGGGEIGVSVSRMNEMPENLPLTSPDVQQWIYYWIFVKVE